MTGARRAGWLVGLLVAAAARNLSGTVLAVDQAAGTIVLGEVGPWRLKDGATEVTRRTIAVTPATEFARVKRLEGAGPNGWIGAFMEERIAAWSIEPGDFATVTVTVDPGATRPTAAKVTVVDVDPPR
jgi:hypothetical protein